MKLYKSIWMVVLGICTNPTQQEGKLITCEQVYEAIFHVVCTDILQGNKFNEEWLPVFEYPLNTLEIDTLFFVKSKPWIRYPFNQGMINAQDVLMKMDSFYYYPTDTWIKTTNDLYIDTECSFSHLKRPFMPEVIENVEAPQLSTPLNIYFTNIFQADQFITCTIYFMDSRKPFVNNSVSNYVYVEIYLNKKDYSLQSLKYGGGIGMQEFLIDTLVVPL